MSRAVDRLRLSGRPLALAKWVFCMPSSWARRVIRAAKRCSVPPSFSAMATAASFADRVHMAWMASATVMVSPGRMPSLVGDCAAAWGEKTTGSSRLILPAESASNVRYSVITLVIDAGYRGASARLAYSPSPERASTTMDAYFEEVCDSSWKYGTCAMAGVEAILRVVARARAIESH